MRLQGISKMGYYPCPPQTLNSIVELLSVRTTGTKIRLLDPCCGNGEAISRIAEELKNRGANVHTIGVELSPQRALTSQGDPHIDLAISADWKEVAISNISCSLLYLNPPYDTEVGNTGDGKPRARLEYQFLRNTVRTLQHDGVLVYIVPERILTDPKVARYLTSNFSNISTHRLPEDEFETFKQIVLFGRKKARAMAENDLMEEMILNAQSGGFRAIDGMINANLVSPYHLPRMNVSDEKFTIKKTSLSTNEIIQAMQTQKNALDSGPWADLQPKYNSAEFHPIIPLRTGHVGSLIASGQMRTVDLGDRVAKGKAIKETRAYDAGGNQVPLDDYEAAVMKEVFNTTVTTLNESGESKTISNVMELQRFLEIYAQDIASIIEHHFSPVYEKPTDQEWLALEHLMKSKKLPGRAKAGLLPVQKHVAIAATRCAKKYGWSDIVGEMGVGKTCISLAALDLINSYPAIVMCPSHLVKKWASEVDEVSGATSKIIESISDLLQFQNDYKSGKLGKKAVAIISKERAKLGSGWEPVTNTTWATILVEKEFHIGNDLPPIKKKVPKRVRVPACPKCGRYQKNKDDTPKRTLGKKRKFCNRDTKVWVGEPDDNTQGEFKIIQCNEPLYSFGSTFKRWPIAHYIRIKMPNFFKALLADEFHHYKGKSSDQAQAYHNLVMATHYQFNLTGTIFGGKSTDLFWLRYRIDPEVRRDYGFDDEHRWAKDYGRLQYSLSNTEDDHGVYSGKRRVPNSIKEVPGISPSIFSRLLKTCIFVRITDLGITLPDYEEEIIRIPMAENQEEQCTWLYNSLLERIQTARQNRDMKGAAKLLSVWLQNSLGRPNSCFRSEMVMWKGDAEMLEDNMNAPERTPYAVKYFPVPEKFEEPIERWPLPEPNEDEQPFDQESNDNLFREEYREWLRFMKNNPEIYSEKAKPMAMPRVVDEDMLLPKERWLIHTVLKERAQNRKVILYVRQTGTRDIQPRLERILRRYGIRAVTLPKGVKPINREKWIAKRTPDIDVLITNPRKVETGLDLIQYHTCIFYETEYSLFTLWQAMRRVWRLGQIKPVKVLFPLYIGTLEEQAMQLIAQKMKASLLLYGDNASSAVADESSDPAGDFLTELANMVLENKDLDINDGFNGIMKEAVPPSTNLDNPLWQEHRIAQDTTPDSFTNPDPKTTPPYPQPITVAVTAPKTSLQQEPEQTQPSLLLFEATSPIQERQKQAQKEEVVNA